MFPLALWNCHLGGLPVVPDKCQPRWSCYGESEVASVLRKLAVRGERLIWQGVPLNWPREHQRVEGKQLRLQSSVDLGSKLCFTTHRIVTLDKSLYFLWASFLHTWKGKRKLTYLSWEFLVAEKLMGTNLNHFKQKRRIYYNPIWAFWGPGVENKEVGGNPGRTLPHVSAPLCSVS